jgi:hypothetical protein
MRASNDLFGDLRAVLKLANEKKIEKTAADRNTTI